MKEIAITGGKGGTGKSTYAVLLGLKLAKEGKKVVLADCDVECPNDHLLLGKELLKGKPIFIDFPKLNEKKCIECGACAKACRRNAIFWVKGKKPIFIENVCDGCGTCFIACKQGAIEKEKRKVGEIFEIRINANFLLVSGRSEIDVMETSPIVHKTREHAKAVAKRVGADYLLIDTAAGMHCSVITALVGTKKIFSVTEPTPLGEHDLDLMLGLIKIIGAKAEIVINKSDVGNKEPIYKLANRRKLKIASEIPYSDRIIRAYSKGELDKLEGII